MTQPLASDPFTILLVTVPDEGTGRDLAAGLVQQRLAACVNILAGLTSVYRWQDEVQTESELLLLIKTTVSHQARVSAWIMAQHPYDVPELLAISVDSLSEAYAMWLRHQLD